MKVPFDSTHAAKHILAGICTAVLIVAAAQGNAQPTSNAATWLDDEAKTTSSGIAADAAKDIDKHIVPSDSESGSILDKILDLLGLGGYFGTPTSDPVKSSATADEHLERLDDRSRANASLEVAGSGVPGKSKGDPRSELAGDLPQPGPLVALRQQAEDEKLASQTHGPRSWVPQFWTDFWKTDDPTDDSSDFYLSELDIYAIFVLAGLAVLGFLLSRRNAAWTGTGDARVGNGNSANSGMTRTRVGPPRRQHSRRAT